MDEMIMLVVMSNELVTTYCYDYVGWPIGSSYF